MDNLNIRKLIKQKRRALSEETYIAMSLSCFDYLKQLLASFDYSTVGSYISMGNEVDTRCFIEYLWQQNKSVYVPKCVENNQMNFHYIHSFKEVEKGSFGLYEPIENDKINNQLDLLIVPLLGYNQEGKRLGMGGGYYDRFIQKYPTLCIGLAFCFQEVDFKAYDHDLKFDYLITEKGIMKF